MGYADRYRCSGCSFTFIDPAEWRVQDRARAASTLPQVARDAPTYSTSSSGGM